MEPCTTCGCLHGLAQMLTAPINHEEERDDFESKVKFLASVPLFHSQLPPAELPKVAMHLKSMRWQRGATLVRQHDTGRALFLIQSGVAEVVVDGDSRCVLTRGDYFGGHTLTTERPNVATILAGPDCTLVTLSLSREQFEELGLRRWLKFPKRPALYDPGSTALLRRQTTFNVAPQEELPAEETTFIRKAISNNANLRALLHASGDKLDELAAGVERRTVYAGDVVARSGSFGNEFFIVREGCLNAVFENSVRGEGRQSAEAAVASSTMAERFLRKQHVLQQLGDTKHKRCPHSRSVIVGKDPRAAKLGANEPAVPRKGTTDRSYSGSSSSAMRRTRSIEWDETMPTRIRACSGNDAEKIVRSSTDEGKPDHGNSSPKAPKGDSAVGAPHVDGPVLGRGDSFGELSIMYNTHLHATFKATEDSILYVINRRHFVAVFNRKGKRFTEFCKLLDNVSLLGPLLSTERWELACNAVGLVDFQPGERVLHQGVPRQTRRWYVIFSGEAIVTHNQQEPDGSTTTETFAHLKRYAHFGERSLLRGDVAAPVNIEAGPDGMCCLTFDGENIYDLLKKVVAQNDDIAPKLTGDLKDWWYRKAAGFGIGARPAAPVWDRLVSHGGIDLLELKKVCVLGRGGFGQVCLVEHEGQRYALKALSKGHIVRKGVQRLVSWERELLAMLDSHFVIKLYQTFKDFQHVYFLMEAALGGSLMHVLRDHPEVFNEDFPRGSSMAFYAACITSAIEHMHERRIVHRDLKPENALLDERGYAKVCDLGFARFVLTKTNTLAGTPEYMAPEMIDFPHTHDRKVDWWAFGVLSFELLAGQTPFDDEGICEPMDRLLAIRRSQERGRLAFPYSFPNVAKNFVSMLLQLNPNSRLGSGGAADVRNHAMFKSLKFDFDAFHAHTLRSPYQQTWTQELDMASDDFGMYRGDVGQEGLGLDPEDSIFVDSHGVENIDTNWDENF